MRRKRTFTFAPALALLALILQMSFPAGESRADTVLISEVLFDATGATTERPLSSLPAHPASRLPDIHWWV